MRLLEHVPYDMLTKTMERELASSGEEVPPNVDKVCRLLCERGVGFILSRNSRAESCRDARSKRVRLGHKGIPLFDEFKSLVKQIETAGIKRLVAVHCRGDCEVVDAKLLAQLGTNGEVEPLDKETLFSEFGLEYGIVNPMLLDGGAGLERLDQVFDSRLLERVANIPGTMMTNAGDHTWAVEFDPAELVRAFPRAIIADVAEVEEAERMAERPETANPRAIGIITGNGPDSGMALWRAINKEIKVIIGESDFLGDISLPRVTVISVPEMGLSMEIKARASATWEALRAAAETLCDMGANIIAIACNTTQVFRDPLMDLCRARGARFISMADVVVSHVQQLGIEKFAIIGIDAVAELGEWSAFRELSRLKPERPSPETLQAIHKIGYNVKQGIDLHRHFQQLIGLLNTQVQADYIVIALTEVSIILESQSKKNRSQQRKVIIDTLEVYAKAIAQSTLGVTGNVAGSASAEPVRRRSERDEGRREG